MAYLVYRLYKKGSEALRKSLREEHIRYFEEDLAVVAYGGSLRGDDDLGIGNMLVLNCDSRDEVTEFLRGDPFHRYDGVFESVIVQRMEVMIKDGCFME